jgi:hypothetical protein
MAEAMMEEVYENEVRKFGKLIITENDSYREASTQLLEGKMINLDALMLLSCCLRHP